MKSVARLLFGPFSHNSADEEKGQRFDPRRATLVVIHCPLNGLSADGGEGIGHSGSW